MIRLSLSNGVETIHLDEQEQTGYGIQAVRGLTGLGLPPVSVQWAEGAGDGALYRGQRVLSRDMDIAFHLRGRNRAHLTTLVSQLVRMITGPCVLRVIEEDGSALATAVHRVGGGDFVYGADNGENSLDIVVTFRTETPYLTSETPSSAEVGGGGTAGLLPALAQLQVSNSQAVGSLQLENRGDAPSIPVWTVTGPGRVFRAEIPGKILQWEGTLLEGESLTIDCGTGTVVDGAGVNRYAELAPAPRFWAIPSGITTATVSLLDTSSASRIRCTWYARYWMTI